MKASDLPETFYVDVAVGVTPFHTLCQMYEVPAHVESQLEGDPEFERRLAIAKQSVEDDGRAFRARCRTVVNNSVQHMQQVMRDPDTPASTQLEAFKTLARFGELEPEKNQTDANTGPQLTLNIIAPDGQSAMSLDMNSGAESEGEVIEHEPRSSDTQTLDVSQLPLMSPDEAERWGA